MSGRCNGRGGLLSRCFVFVEPGLVLRWQSSSSLESLPVCPTSFFFFHDVFFVGEHRKDKVKNEDVFEINMEAT